MKKYELNLSDDGLEILTRILDREFQLTRKPEVEDVIIDVTEQLHKQSS